ncbi:O-methyltransferase [Paenibacillus sp. 2TAB19]|uniref:O-methyltransferase n=1 Tax=Paenibacillus sp. 2TAB19 TaxID=3233003 RepID=UPI003F9DEE69
MFLNEQYVDDLYAKDADLEHVKAVLAERGMPDISVADGYGRLLTMLVRLKGASSVLEIGALGGYSGICLARGMGEAGKLVSLELLQHYADVAKANMEAAGLGDKVEYVVGDAKASLAQLASEGRKFDFFFIDADKEGYPIYLDFALEMSNPGALIVGDNIFLRGRTVDGTKQGPAVRAVRSFNERIATDERLMSTVIPGYDGLAIAIVK